MRGPDSIAVHPPNGFCAGTALRPARVPSPPFWLPMLILLAVSACIRFGGLDQAAARLFWSPESGWRWEKSAAATFLYHYGPWPAFAAAGVGVLFCAGYLLGKLPLERAKLGAYLIIVLILGPGLLVNGAFKDHFGRPRPRQVTMFHGSRPFEPVGTPVLGGPGHSFPSGHAAMGFYWLGLYIYFYGRNRAAAAAFSILGAGEGLAIGLARMAQGGHWASDVLWSAGMVYMTAWIVHRSWFSQPACAGTEDVPLSPASTSKEAHVR
jgi:membrane-associated PAP2 superfamily phosphatase